MGEKVEMGVGKQPKEGVKKELSYEELKTIAVQLSDENQKLRQAVNNMNYQTTITQLDFLLKILNSGQFEPYIEDKCRERVIDIMDLRDKPEGEKESSSPEIQEEE